MINADVVEGMPTHSEMLNFLWEQKMLGNWVPKEGRPIEEEYLRVKSEEKSD